MKGATRVGQYKVNFDAQPFTIDFGTPGYIQYFEPGAGYVTTSTHVGWFNLTRCDTARGIYSGTFELQATPSLQPRNQADRQHHRWAF